MVGKGFRLFNLMCEELNFVLSMKYPLRTTLKRRFILLREQLLNLVLLRLEFFSRAVDFMMSLRWKSNYLENVGVAAYETS